MSTYGGGIVSNLQWMFGNLEPLRDRKNPGVAAVVGFLFGGIGLGIYLRNFIDFIIPIVLSVLLFVVTGQDLGFLVGACVASAYGYFRVTNSNQRIGV